MTTKQQFIYEEVPALLDQLTEDSRPLWGIMGPQHMIEHISGITYLGLGKREIPLATAEENLERSHAWLMSDKPFRPFTKAVGIPQDQPLPLRFASFAEAREKFKSTLKAFQARAQADPGKRITHPIFGPLNAAEWEHFQDKHLRHHMMQFGLIPLSDYVKEKLAQS